MKKKVIVFGNRESSAMNYFYLTHDSPYDVIAFTVDEAYIKEDSQFGLPVVPFEAIEDIYPPTEYLMSVLLGFKDVNKLRAQKYFEAKEKGYRLINYISSKATVWPGLKIGDNCYVYENTVIHPFSVIDNNVVISSGGVIGHDCRVKDHCFLASSTTLLGCVTLEPYCFLGASVTVTEWVTIAPECIVGAGSLITKDTSERGVYISKPAELLPKPSNELGGILTWSLDLRRR